MSFSLRNKIAGSSLLGLLCGSVLLAPGSTAAPPSLQSFELSGLVRDFHKTHSDFDIYVPCVLCGGHAAGNLDLLLTADGKPTFVGGGFKVDAEWQDVAGNPIAAHLYAGPGPGPLVCGMPLVDSPGTAGDASNTNIQSSDSFDQWYHDELGVNLAERLTITLTNDGAGVYEYLDDAFFPIDGKLFGNEGDAHNYNYTYAIKAKFEFKECTGQFLDMKAADDAWVFINGQLVMDLGGIVPQSGQFVQLDRLGLVDGEFYEMHIFHAQRQGLQAQFRLRTNIRLIDEPNMTVSGMFD